MKDKPYWAIRAGRTKRQPSFNDLDSAIGVLYTGSQWPQDDDFFLCLFKRFQCEKCGYGEMGMVGTIPEVPGGKKLKLGQELMVEERGVNSFELLQKLLNESEAMGDGYTKQNVDGIEWQEGAM